MHLSSITKAVKCTSVAITAICDDINVIQSSAKGSTVFAFELGNLPLVH